MDKIIAVHPELSRKWLYFGEVHMLAAEEADNEELQAVLDELQIARQRTIDLDETVNALKFVIAAKEETIEAYRKFYAERVTPERGNMFVHSSDNVAHSFPLASIPVKNQHSGL